MDDSSSDSEVMSGYSDEDDRDHYVTSNHGDPPVDEQAEPPGAQTEVPQVQDPSEPRPVNIECPPAVEPFPQVLPSFMSDSDGSEFPDLSCKEQLMEIAREWVMMQLGKVCSNEVADSYFSMAWDMCETFVQIKDVLEGKKPSLKQLRRKVVEENVPGIKLDYIIRDKNDADEAKEPIYLYNLPAFPAKQYPLSRYEILNQITRIDVSFRHELIICVIFSFTRHLTDIYEDIYKTST